MDFIAGVSPFLTDEMAEKGYRMGLFPMGHPGSDLITWHAPDPRAVIPLDAFHLSRSLRRTIRGGGFEVTFDQDFEGVIEGCADRTTTWITEAIRKAYIGLFKRGRAHSVEVWEQGKLVGGLYGVHLGGAFFAESKFHRVTGASKVALAHLLLGLRNRHFLLLEDQYLTPHLEQFGTIEWRREEYLKKLAEALGVERLFMSS